MSVCVCASKREMSEMMLVVEAAYMTLKTTVSGKFVDIWQIYV